MEEPTGQPVWAKDKGDVVRSVVARANSRLVEPVIRHDYSPTQIAGPVTERPVVDTSEGELKIIQFPVIRQLNAAVGSSMAALQEWEGVITAIEGDTVFADLLDVTAGRRDPDETGEIPLIEFLIEDRPKLHRGVIFRWAIGYLTTPDGVRVGASNLRLRPNVRSTISRPVAPMAFEPE